MSVHFSQSLIKLSSLYRRLFPLNSGILLSTSLLALFAYHTMFVLADIIFLPFLISNYILPALLLHLYEAVDWIYLAQCRGQ